MAKAKRALADYPEIKAILERLEGGKPDEYIAIFIPSHDRKNKPLPDQKIWADQALALFGKLFTGATGFTNLSGIYQPKKDLRALFDDPIMIQSLTATENIRSEANLLELAAFCQNLGTKTNQMSIGVVVNNKFIDIPMKHESGGGDE
ncbi:MAG: hypothetical protein JWN40_1952 [Phycisphaerales bacterium]|nr:hypothetical protein [Phycisphaerales bacterium]